MRYFMVELPDKLHRKRKTMHDFKTKRTRALFNKKHFFFILFGI